MKSPPGQTRASDWLEENFFDQIPSGDFFAKIQGKQCAQTEMSSRARSNLPTWGDINRFISEHRLTHPRVRMSLEGATTEQLRIFSERQNLRGETILDILLGRVYSNLRAGGTLVLDSIDQATPSVREITQAVTHHFFVKAQTNAYVTFGKTRGFGLHWDDHDVFVVQIYGCKRWNMYGTTRKSPMNMDFHGQHEVPKTLTESIDLRPGSVLYVPRGCWHDVVGIGEPTLHLTVGVTAPTGIDMLDWLKEHARNSEFFRQDVPLHQPDKALQYSEAFLAQLSRLLPANGAQVFLEQLKSSVRSYPRFSLPFGIGNTLDLGATQIRLVPDVYNVRHVEDRIFIEANNQVWKLPSGTKAFIQALQTHRMLSVADSWALVSGMWPHTAYEDWLTFIDGLVAQGLIYLEEEGKLNTITMFSHSLCRVILSPAIPCGCGAGRAEPFR